MRHRGLRGGSSVLCSSVLGAQYPPSSRRGALPHGRPSIPRSVAMPPRARARCEENAAFNAMLECCICAACVSSLRPSVYTCNHQQLVRSQSHHRFSPGKSHTHDLLSVSCCWQSYNSASGPVEVTFSCCETGHHRSRCSSRCPLAPRTLVDASTVITGGMQRCN